MKITSKDNKICKLVKSLKLKKYRDELGLFIIEGQRAVSDVLDYSPSLVKHVLVREDREGFFPGETVLDHDVFDSLTETENSQGILAVAVKPEKKDISSSFVLFLDGIRDPGNEGTLLRTALAAGFNDVILKDCCDEYSGKAVRSSMSAIAKINIVHYSSSVVEKIQGMGYNIIYADMNGRSVFDYSVSGRVCLVIGSEATGVSDEIRKISNECVCIPMSGNIESLNAAVSGGILMYNLINNRRN